MQLSNAAMSVLTAFLEEKFGSCLKAWLWHFDPDNDKHMGRKAFVKSMERWGYHGDAEQLFNDLDTDRSSQLIFNEVNPEQAALWRKFIRWCCMNFRSCEDLRCGFQGITKYDQNFRKPIDMPTFIQGLQRYGWKDGQEEFIFDALDADSSGELELADLMFLNSEFYYHGRKAKAKQRAVDNPALYGWSRTKTISDEELERFKRFLKHRYGNFIRAWRVGLCTDDAKKMRQNQFLKACAQMGWVRDSKLLWKYFDDDMDGWMSFDELDLKTAELLARFRDFVVRTFGSAQAAFRTFDKRGLGRLKQDEWCQALHSYGFTEGTKQLFQGLDKAADKVLQQEDMLFVDTWEPLQFLIEPADYQALEDLKRVLASRYKTLLNAWRRALDGDGSNRCSWIEFVAGCNKVHFRGNIPGAWRAADEDLSGSVTFTEIDEVIGKSIEEFKLWADAEFGGIRSLFGVFNEDNSAELTFKEFQHSCRVYGFIGDLMFFKCLDPDGKGVGMEQMAFIDKWEFNAAPENQEYTEGRDAAATPAPTRESSKQRSPSPSKSRSPSKARSPPPEEGKSNIQSGQGHTATRREWNKATLARSRSPTHARSPSPAAAAAGSASAPIRNDAQMQSPRRGRGRAAMVKGQEKMKARSPSPQAAAASKELQKLRRGRARAVVEEQQEKLAARSPSPKAAAPSKQLQTPRRGRVSESLYGQTSSKKASEAQPRRLGKHSEGFGGVVPSAGTSTAQTTAQTKMSYGADTAQTKLPALQQRSPKAFPALDDLFESFARKPFWKRVKAQSAAEERKEAAIYWPPQKLG